MLIARLGAVFFRSQDLLCARAGACFPSFEDSVSSRRFPLLPSRDSLPQRRRRVAEGGVATAPVVVHRAPIGPK